MGTPIAPILADIFMIILLETRIQNREIDIKNVVFLNISNGLNYIARFFTRYFDDIFEAFNDLETAYNFLLHFLITYIPTLSLLSKKR